MEVRTEKMKGLGIISEEKRVKCKNLSLKAY